MSPALRQAIVTARKLTQAVSDADLDLGRAERVGNIDEIDRAAVRLSNRLHEANEAAYVVATLAQAESCRAFDAGRAKPFEARA